MYFLALSRPSFFQKHTLFPRRMSGAFLSDILPYSFVRIPPEGSVIDDFPITEQRGYTIRYSSFVLNNLLESIPSEFPNPNSIVSSFLYNLNPFFDGIDICVPNFVFFIINGVCKCQTTTFVIADHFCIVLSC